MSLYTESEVAKIAIPTVNAILAVINITGNSLVCAIVLRNHDMRTSMNYLLVNLAIADMTVATFLAPRYVFIHTFTHPDGLAGTVLCKLITGGNFAWIGAGASVFTLVAIAIERYYSVTYPHGNKGKLTNRKLKVIIPCAWIFGTILTFPEFLARDYDEKAHSCSLMFTKELMGKAYSLVWFLAVALFPVLLMVTLYSKVVYVLWCKRTVVGGDINVRQGVLKVRKRVTFMMITISVIFAVCWMTESITNILRCFTPVYTVNDVTLASANALIMFNSAINPIVFALVNHRFREKIKRIMCCACACWPYSTTNRISTKKGNGDCQ